MRETFTLNPLDSTGFLLCCPSSPSLFLFLIFTRDRGTIATFTYYLSIAGMELELWSLHFTHFLGSLSGVTECERCQWEVWELSIILNFALHHSEIVKIYRMQCLRHPFLSRFITFRVFASWANVRSAKCDGLSIPFHHPLLIAFTYPNKSV